MSERIPVKNIPAVKIHKPDSSQHNNEYSPRSPIYMRAVKGPLEIFRNFFGLFFVALFAALPWITYNGQQAILFDIYEQRFDLFSLTLWPQDLTIFALILIVAAYGLFFVTTFAGRVWCGFMCPQTAWTFIFMWFEEKIEGSRNKRIKLDQRKLDFDKFWRKSLKHFAWLAVALLTALTFVGYFTPIRALFAEFFVLEASAMAIGFVIFFTFCTYGNAGWMREIMCTHICPYARFQSVMFDKDTLIVAYDTKRGEKRGPRRRKMTEQERQEKSLGDCVDCNLCVQVCPTGIDIRNGLQYECISCGKCVDACNDTMDKMGYQRDLISFTSEHKLEGKKTKFLRPKLIGYAAVMVVMLIVMFAQMLTRQSLDVDILRDRNTLYRETYDGLIENTYTLKIMNRTQLPQTYRVEVSGLEGLTLTGTDKVSIEGGELLSLPISVSVEAWDLKAVNDIRISIIDTDEPDVRIDKETKFLYR